MSAKTDDALQNIQNIIAKGMPHKDEMYAVQGYCDMLTKEIAELESDIETLHTDLNTIVPQQDKEIEKLNHDLDAEHHRANIEEERAKEWKATAELWIALRLKKFLLNATHRRINTMAKDIRITKVSKGYIVNKGYDEVYTSLDDVFEELLAFFEGRREGFTDSSYGKVTVSRLWPPTTGAPKEDA
jgi:predicted RNase H-like nuclease (RuvC/YqgF family)